MNYPLLQTRGKSGASYKVVAYTEMVSHGVYKPTMGDYVDSFYANLQKWRSETYYLSSAVELQKHPGFQAIVRMGEAVVPLILDDLKRNPSLLSLALVAITGESAVPDSDRGNVRAMANAWIAWGQRNGL